MDAGTGTGVREDPDSIGIEADSYAYGASRDGDILDDFGADELRSDVDLLRRVWQNEKCAPEILPYEGSLVERVREQIQLMEENIEAFSTEIKDDLMLSLYRMDVNRTLFLLRSYLRARLTKIERHPIHIVDNPELWDRLSEHEQEYTNKYCEVLAKHFEQTVLIRLPEQYGSMLKQTSLASEENDMSIQQQRNEKHIALLMIDGTREQREFCRPRVTLSACFRLKRFSILLARVYWENHFFTPVSFSDDNISSASNLQILGQTLFVLFPKYFLWFSQRNLTLVNGQPFR